VTHLVAGTWQDTTFAGTPEPDYYKTGPEIIIDPAGTVHVVYWDDDAQALIHAYAPGGGSFISETVAGGASEFAVALDNQGNLVISQGPTLLTRASGGTWTSDTCPLVTANDASVASNLVFDAQGVAHVLFWESDSAGGAVLRYASR
jgi:streptogramin lyase